MLIFLILQTIGEQLGELGLAQGQFSDVLFKLEDGTQGAHKPLLMARSVLRRPL
jgi:hypothetical protein